MSYYPEPDSHTKDEAKVVLDMSNYATKRIEDFENKISDLYGLVTASVLNTKIGEAENKISGHIKYITTPELNEFADSIFNTKLKRAKI